MEELNNDKLLDELKEYINNQIENGLKSYCKDYPLDSKTQKNILKYAKKRVTNIVNNWADKYLNNDVRDKIQDYQDKWDIAIENEKYDKADALAEKIRKSYNTALFKDEELKTRNLRTIYIDDLLDEKRENGEKVELTRVRIRWSSKVYG